VTVVTIAASGSPEAAFLLDGIRVRLRTRIEDDDPSIEGGDGVEPGNPSIEQ
jgi:hypothetical protein